MEPEEALSLLLAAALIVGILLGALLVTLALGL